MSTKFVDHEVLNTLESIRQTILNLFREISTTEIFEHLLTAINAENKNILENTEILISGVVEHTLKEFENININMQELHKQIKYLEKKNQYVYSENSDLKKSLEQTNIEIENLETAIKHLKQTNLDYKNKLKNAKEINLEETDTKLKVENRVKQLESLTKQINEKNLELHAKIKKLTENNSQLRQNENYQMNQKVIEDIKSLEVRSLKLKESFRKKD